MFMWRRRFRWRDITALCSGDGHRCDKCLTESPGAKYAQQWDKPGFFINVTTVWYLSGLVGEDTGPFRGQRNHPATGHQPKHPRNGKTAT